MKMSCSFKLRSHPDKLLIDHLENVGRLSEGIINSKHIKHKDILAKVVYLIGVTHDFAKATTFFQKRFDNREEQTEKARHGFLSSLLGYYLVKRHLFKINKLAEFQHFPVYAWIAIKRHHGNVQNVRWDALNAEISALDESGKEIVQEQIEDIVENNLDEVIGVYEKLLEDFDIREFIEIVKSWKEFAKEIKMDVVKICREKGIRHFFNILFLYSVLLDADKLDASETEIPSRIRDVKKVIVDNYKKSKFSVSGSFIEKIREEAYKEVNNFIEKLDLRNEQILAINLPTGMGKTLTGLSFSLGLRERIEKELSFTPKIIYCLPFLSIIDQNSEVIEEVFKIGGKYDQIPSNLFLKHHHLADIIYKEEKDGELDPIKDLNKSLLLVEGWNSEIVITTFVQFFHSLITNRNRAARKFHNILNSIIILDEVQSIPHKYWLLIKESLTHLAEEFNCWILLMTATQPLIFEGEKEIKHLLRDKEKYFQVFDRVEFNFDLDERGKFNETEFDSFKSKILDEIINNNDKNLMVVLNTIGSCKELYDFLKEKLSEVYGADPGPEERLDEDGICIFSDMDLINLSTNILPSFRLKRINKIKDKKKRKIVITTQLIEAGVDISVDVIYRDMAPLDCIIQSAGRCNRNNEKREGKIHVVLLKDENGRKFYSYIYDPMLIEATLELIKGFGRTVSEKDFVANATAKYYGLIKARASRDVSRNLLGNLRKLNFADISEFRLIEEKLPSISVFIEIDGEAEKIREEVEEIFSLEKGFKRREKLLEIRREINENTISARYSGKTESIKSLPFLEGEFFRYVPKRELDSWYKLDTGFYVSEDYVRII
jgi:CRISPR-associated endonuclease/helicase Cas3